MMPDPIVERLAKTWQALCAHECAGDESACPHWTGAIRAAFLEAAKVAKDAAAGCDCWENIAPKELHFPHCGASIAARLKEIARGDS